MRPVRFVVVNDVPRKITEPSPKGPLVRILLILLHKPLLLEEVDQDHIGPFLETFENDLLSVWKDIEVADQVLCVEVRELTPLSVCQIDRPEVFVPELPFHHDQHLLVRQECKTARA